MPENLGNSERPWDKKWSVFIPIPKKSNAKECSNYHTIVFISHASQSNAQNPLSQDSTVCNQELPDIEKSLEKAEEPEIKLPVGSQKNQENSRKTFTSASFSM